MSKPPEKKSEKPARFEGQEVDDFAQEIANRIGNLVSREQKAQVVAQVVSLVSEERFSGPIAHPRHLREYEEICPGAADRIINMAESSLTHAQNLQARALEGDIEDAKSGRLYGFIAFLAIIAGATASAYFGHEVLAGLFLGAGVLGIIGQFIRGRGTNHSGG